MDLSNEQLVKHIQSGIRTQESLETLYEKNYPFMYKIASKYVRFLDIEDSMQAAFFGLKDAAEHYEESRGNFLKVLYLYVSGVIRQEIRNQSNISEYMFTRMNKYRQAVEALQQELFREPTTKEVAERMRLKPEEVELVRMMLAGDYSLDSSIENEDGNESTLADTLQSETDAEADAIESVYSEEAKIIWDICKDAMSPAQYEVVRDTFLHGKTLTEIAKEKGCSVQNVKETQANGLRALKKPSFLSYIDELLDIQTAKEYKTSFKGFCERNYTSRTEIVGLARYEASKRFE